MRQWNDAIEAIDADLTGPVDVADLARVAMTSEYHFRRMFATLAGMPVSEYVRRRRLTAATAELLGGAGVLETAVRYGYGSAEAFTRAFRQLHGLTPTQARRPGAVLRSQPKLRFHLRVEGSTEMRHRIVEKEAFRIVGFTERVPLVHEGPNAAIEEFTRSLDPARMAELKGLSGQESGGDDPFAVEPTSVEPTGVVSATVSIDADRADGSMLDYWLGVVTTAEAPDGFAQLDVPAGTWVVFDTEGPFPEVLQRMWADAATEWFPANPYRWSPGPEILRSRPADDDWSRGSGQLWLPVERE